MHWADIVSNVACKTVSAPKFEKLYYLLYWQKKENTSEVHIL